MLFAPAVTAYRSSRSKPIVSPMPGLPSLKSGVCITIRGSTTLLGRPTETVRRTFGRFGILCAGHWRPSGRSSRPFRPFMAELLSTPPGPRNQQHQSFRLSQLCCLHQSSLANKQLIRKDVWAAAVALKQFGALNTGSNTVFVDSVPLHTPTRWVSLLQLLLDYSMFCGFAPPVLSGQQWLDPGLMRHGQLLTYHMGQRNQVVRTSASKVDLANWRGLDGY